MYHGDVWYDAQGEYDGIASMAALKVTKRGEMQVTHILDKPIQIVGRDPICDIRLKQSNVSRRHAEIIASSDGFRIIDHGSHNGTYVNLRQLEPHRACDLREGDVIRICEFDLFFCTEVVDVASDSKKAVIETVTHPDTVSPDEEDSASLDSSVDGLDSRLPLNSEAKLAALMQITRDLHGALTLEQLLARIPGSILRVLPQAERATVIFPESEGGIPIARATSGRLRDSANAVSQSVVNRALATGQAVVTENVIADSAIENTESIHNSGIKSLMCAPIVNTRDQSIGAIQVDTLTRPHQFSMNDLDLLTTVTMQVSLAVETARAQEKALWTSAMRSQLTMAREIQAGLLPRSSPDLTGYDFFDYYAAAQDIGGDCFDYVPTTDGRLAVVVADVCDKGIPAAMLMANFSSEVKAQLRSGRGAAETVALVNDAICERSNERFITMILMVIDPVANELEVVNAGHWSPLLRRGDRSIIELTSGNKFYPVGLVSNSQYESFRIEIRPDDVVIAFSDGIIDAQNVLGEAYE